MGTKTEDAFADYIKKQGWDANKNGFPDFICTKGNEIIFVEVKASCHQRLARHQVKTINILKRFFNISIFRWSPDVNQLDDIDKVILKPRGISEKNKLIYGWYLSHPGITYAATGKLFNLSRERIRQIINKAKSIK